MVENDKQVHGWENPSQQMIARIIREATTVAVVGLSSDRERPAHRVAKYLQRKGFEIIPVNPRESEILGEKAYPDLASISKNIDIVDVFRRPEDTPAVVVDAVKAGARYIWLQEGIVSREAYGLAERSGIPIIMDRCLKKEHSRLKS